MSTVSSSFYTFTCPARGLFIKFCLTYLGTDFLAHRRNNQPVLGLASKSYEK